MQQHYITEDWGHVVFVDKKAGHHSVLCQPRDIRIIEGPDDKLLRQEIAIYVRRQQGCDPDKVARRLKF